MQAQAQILLEPQKRSLKAKTTKAYFGISHIDFYHFYQQCKNYFKILVTIKINRTSLATSYLYDFFSFK